MTAFLTPIAICLATLDATIFALRVIATLAPLPAPVVEGWP